MGALHCGSGCTLGDIVSEIFLLVIPVILFGSKLYGGWLVSYFFAFAIGIIFQYYSIKPMKNLSGGKAIVAALKADALPLTSWQIGMYGWMASAVFVIYHHRLESTTPIFWVYDADSNAIGLCNSLPHKLVAT